MHQLTVLGSTGSIGRSTLDVVRRHPERFNVVALAANADVTRMLADCLEFRPQYAVLVQEDAAVALRLALAEAGIQDVEVLSGAVALQEVARLGVVDTVMAAIVGSAGLLSALAAIEAAQRLLATDIEPTEAIDELGEGWVAEEALAIGVYCALKAQDLESGVIMAVNHDGDSDSTGLIAGHLLGEFPHKKVFGDEAQFYITPGSDQPMRRTDDQHIGASETVMGDHRRDHRARRGRPHGRPRLPARRHPDSGGDARRRAAHAVLRDARQRRRQAGHALPAERGAALGRRGALACRRDDAPCLPRRRRR